MQEYPPLYVLAVTWAAMWTAMLTVTWTVVSDVETDMDSKLFSLTAVSLHSVTTAKMFKQLKEGKEVVRSLKGSVTIVGMAQLKIACKEYPTR